MIGQICKTCGEPFFAKAHRVNKGQARFCSLACYRASPRPNSKIERVCETCGNLFAANPYCVKKGQAKFCSLACSLVALHSKRDTREYRTCETCGTFFLASPRALRKFCSRKCSDVASMGKPKSEEHKRKIGEANKGRKRPDFALIRHEMTIAGRQRGANNPNYGKHHSDEIKEKIRQKRLAYITRTPIDDRRPSKETNQKVSEARKKDWQNPEYVAKLIRAMGIKPNKLEGKLIDLLAEHFPQFKYNGDFGQGVMLGGLTPDFVNVNGKKQVIEVFGDYWHSPEIIGDDWRRGELGKIMIYNSVGWDCLVLWERELKELTEKDIIEKVKSFSRR